MIKKIRKWIRGSQTLSRVLGQKEYRRYLHGDIGFKVVEKNYFRAKNILLIAPHFDDEIFACGGTISQFAKAGSQITVLYLTDGSRGTKTGKKDSNLSANRKQEADRAIKKLGDNIAKVYWDYPDGEISVDQAIIDKMSSFIVALSPSHIFIPLFADDNDDHAIAYKIAAAAIESESKKIAGSEVWQYELWTPLIPNRIVPIGDVIEQKKSAIIEHKSQLACRDYTTGIIGLNNYRGVVTGEIDQPAEAFFALPVDRFVTFDKTVARIHLF